MDIELINAYVEKQRDMIHDLMSRVIMSETKEGLLGKKIGELQQQFDEVSKRFEVLKKDNTKLTTENCSMGKDLFKLQAIVNNNTLEILRLKTDVNQPKKKKIKSSLQKQQDSE